TRKSPRKSASDIAWIGLRAAITGVIQKARSAPSPPPPSARSKVSLSSCLTIRPGLAPSAKRMPISRSRTTPRTSKRLARFAQQWHPQIRGEGHVESSRQNPNHRIITIPQQKRLADVLGRARKETL